MNPSKPHAFFEKIGLKMRRSLWTKGALLALITLSVIYVIGEVHQLSFAELRKSRRIIEGNPYLIDTPGCRIPNLQAESAEAMAYMSAFGPINCGHPPLVESNDTHLQIIYSLLPKYGISDQSEMSCCYRPMWRHVPDIVINRQDKNASWLFDKKIYDNDIRYSNHCYPFHYPVDVHHHFVRIECGRGFDLKEFYRDYHAFFPKPASSKKEQTDKPLVNVLLLGIDSLSRLNMIRKMPLTYKYISNTLKGIPMFGYNKIGLNTFPNLVPLLSGSTVNELANACWYNYTAHFDLCPWIWDTFAAKGYRSAYMEDAPDMAMFTYYLPGFAVQPTDYYASTMFIPAQDEIVHELHYCLGSRNQIEVLLNYTLKQLRAMKRYDENFITLSWGVTLSHDLINQPQQGDPLYHNLLQNIHEEGMLNNTFMIFLSDHGLRFGDFLQTAQGKLEGNLPALFFVVPEWFQKKYVTAMHNLRSNQYRLLTALDLHATLRDLADLPQIESAVIKRRTKTMNEEKKGISLFLPIPKDRTCKEANIPDEFCACEHLEKADVDLPEVAKAAQCIVDEINYHILRNHSSCVPRTVTEVQEAARGFPLLKNDKDGGVIIEYEVSVYTDPGYALFSAIVRHFTSNDSMQMVGEVSRLNKYGTQSHCMEEYTLLPFCYCKEPYEVDQSISESGGRDS